MPSRRGNGEGNIRQKSDGRWEARYTLPDGTRKYITGHKDEPRAEVARRLHEALHNLDRGITPQRDERQMLGDYLDQWLILKKPNIEPTYWRRLEEAVRIYIKPVLGHIPLTKLTAQQLQQLYAPIHAEWGAKRVIPIHKTIRMALNHAVKHDLIARNVAKLVDAPKPEHHEMSVYTPEQADKLVAAARGDRLEALYVLMITSCCRWGELVGLRWDALDLERRELHVTSVLKQIKSTRYFGSPKTPNSRRSIPLTQLAVDLLHRHKVAQTAERFKHGIGWNPDNLVFCTTTGTAYSAQNWHHECYRPLIQRAGLPYIRPHDIRHTAATLLLLDGVPAIVVSRMLGHANVAFTLQTYGHVLAEMREMARDAMERRFGTVYEPAALIEGAGDDA